MNGRGNHRIGFWLGHASLKFGGVGAYAWRILNSLLSNIEPGWRFELLCESEAQESAVLVADNSHGMAAVNLIPSLDMHDLEKWIHGLELDLVHFPMPTPPFPAAHQPYLVPPLLELRIPYIVTIHDVQELHLPSYFSPAQRAIRAMHHWKTLDHARKVVVSYEHVKADLIKLFGLHEDKIRVCPIPFNSISLEEPSADASLAYTEKYRAWKPFLLYPSQTWRHKNHIQLLHALQSIVRQDELNLKLICTGAKSDYYPEVAKEVERLGLEDSVLFTGLVPEGELCWLYRNTVLVTIPTEYEAGSFPLYEAMLQSAPVICSDVTSLPETIADRRFVFNPYDVDELSGLIRRMLTEGKLREQNIKNSHRRADELRSINAAIYFYATYRSILGYA